MTWMFALCRSSFWHECPCFGRDLFWSGCLHANIYSGQIPLRVCRSPCRDGLLFEECILVSISPSLQQSIWASMSAYLCRKQNRHDFVTVSHYSRYLCGDLLDVCKKTRRIQTTTYNSGKLDCKHYMGLGLPKYCNCALKDWSSVGWVGGRSRDHTIERYIEPRPYQLALPKHKKDACGEICAKGK